MAAVASARRALARSTKPLVCYAVEQLPAKKGGDVERLKQCFQQNLALLRMSRAWDVALLVDQRELYAKLGVQAL